MAAEKENQRLKILLIEDNPGDARLIREMLRETAEGQFELFHAERLSNGLNSLRKGSMDLVLLDLVLPDGQGLDTLKRAQDEAPHVPIIVLTGLDDLVLAMKAMRAGAQDYLSKGDLDGKLLVRSIRYAVERQGLLEELQLEREKRRQEAEITSLQRLSGPSPTAVTERLFDLAPLAESVPSTFGELVGTYSSVMVQALEERTHKVDYQVSDRLKALAEQLGFLKAGPRDVVEMHCTALKGQTEGATGKKAAAYVDEGRVMVLEVMGHLADFYRKYATGYKVSR